MNKNNDDLNNNAAMKTGWSEMVKNVYSFYFNAA